MTPPAPQPPPSAVPAAPIDLRRYRRVRWFFARLFLNVFWHDVILAAPLLRLLRGDPLPRWCALARRYRLMAVAMGGVLIKLGQYLSTRFDVLPLEVIRELSGLQDEVPAEDFATIEAQIAEDFGRPSGEVFGSIEREVLAAASLAQVHAAVLPGGQPVVVKVLRPGIDVLVETDLKAIGVAIRWLKTWGFIRRRVDLDWLVEEFTDTTRRELDFEAEGRFAERFAANFAKDDSVYIPKVYWEFSARRTLTEENVGFLKAFDIEALTAAGVDPRELAKTLYRVYMQQIFVDNFVHADPHPGNLFVRPLRGPDDPPDFRAVPGQPVPPGRARPFQIVFVDFGMVAEVPERLRAALRQLVIGAGTRDAGKVIRAAADAGILLPGADLQALEEALDSMFDRFWGADIGRLQAMMKSEAVALMRELGQLVLETPVQVQADLLFIGRAAGLLGGMATRLDPNFNPWNEMIPFAERLAKETITQGWPELLQRFVEQAQVLAGLPQAAGKVFQQAQRGRLQVRAALAPDTRRHFNRLERAVEKLNFTVMASAVLLAGALLFESLPRVGAAVMIGGAVLVGLALVRSLLG